jgi:hypothetical protein
MEQRMTGTLRVWSAPFVALRLPKLFNLLTDPYERADITSNTYNHWQIGCHQRRFINLRKGLRSFRSSEVRTDVPAPRCRNLIRTLISRGASRCGLA